MSYVNIANEINQNKMADKVSKRIATAMINYSELQDKGRFFSGVDFSHFIHLVLPSMVKSAIQDYVEEVTN